MDSGGLPNLLMQAARSAAAADGVAVPKEESSPNYFGGGGRGNFQNANLMAKNAALQNAQNLNFNGAANNRILNQMNGNRMPPNQVISSSMSGGVRDDEALSESPETASENNNKGAAGGGEAEESTNRRKAPLRRGKWTPEEEAYANRLIQEFKAGLLPLTDGTTLRTFLSKLLNCDPMRISKKFVGSNCIGKQVFRRRGADVNNLTPDQIQKTRLELSELEKKFLDRVAQNKGKSSGTSGGGGTGGGGGKGQGRNTPSTNTNPPAQDTKTSAHSDSMASMSVNMTPNKSAAAAGRALLQGGSSLNQNMNQAASAGGLLGGNNNGGADLLTQLRATQPGIFDNAGNLVGAAAGMNRDQIGQLAQNKGLNSPASLANMIGKKRSFDGLTSLDFQSMQSIDNLANLIQAGLPNQAPSSGTKNWDWGNTSNNNTGDASSTFNNATFLGNQGNSMNSNAPQAGQGTTLENLVNSLSGQGNNTAQAAGTTSNQSNTNFGDLLQSMQQGNISALGSNNNNNPDFNSFLQSLQQQNQQSNSNSFGGQSSNYGNLLQGMQNQGGGGNNIEALLQNMQNTNNNNYSSGNNSNGNNNNNFGNELSGLQQMQGGRNFGTGNDLFSNLMNGSNNNGNHQYQNQFAQLNDPFSGFQSGQSNPMMALAQQQLFGQAGKP